MISKEQGNTFEALTVRKAKLIHRMLTVIDKGEKMRQPISQRDRPLYDDFVTFCFVPPCLSFLPPDTMQRAVMPRQIVRLSKTKKV